MKRGGLGWKYALIVIGLAILTLLVMDFNSRMAELRRLSDQREVVAAQVTQLARTQAHQETEIAYAASEAAVYEWAYQEGRWIREGDFPIVPLAPPGSTPTPVVVQVPTPQPRNNWEIWLSLFMDEGAP